MQPSAHIIKTYLDISRPLSIVLLLRFLSCGTFVGVGPAPLCTVMQLSPWTAPDALFKSTRYAQDLDSGGRGRKFKFCHTDHFVRLSIDTHATLADQPRSATLTLKRIGIREANHAKSTQWLAGSVGILVASHLRNRGRESVMMPTADI